MLSTPSPPGRRTRSAAPSSGPARRRALLALTDELLTTAAVVTGLLCRGHGVCPAEQPQPGERPPDLVLVGLGLPGACGGVELARALGVPWIGVDVTSADEIADQDVTGGDIAGRDITDRDITDRDITDRDITDRDIEAAYRDGAISVVATKPSPAALLHAVDTALGLTSPARVGESIGPEQRYSPGERLRADGGAVVEIVEGVLLTRALHDDGESVLLDLAAAGQLVLPHPADGCAIETVAHTAVVARIGRWADAAERAGTAERLREQLRWREAWAAAQARPRTEDRLLSLLALLAERFGVPACDDVTAATAIDVQLTHALLASATARTRPTVTRAIRRLCRRGELAVRGRGPRARFVLPSLVHGRVMIHDSEG